MPDTKRVPIVVSEHTIALLTLFNKPFDSLDDMWALGWIAEEVHTYHERSADAFMLIRFSHTNADTH